MLNPRPAEWEEFGRWLYRAHGLRMGDYRLTFLARRLAPRVTAAGCSDLASYMRRLESDREEARVLLKKLLVPTTEFFRNPEVFAALARLLGERAGEEGWRPLRLMSAPCSTGEEALSLAVLLAELGLDGRVLAGDRSLPALGVALQGHYQRRGLERVDLNRRARYFRNDGERFTASPDIRSRVCPVLCDLGEAIPARGLHVLLMRNVFIYMTLSAQRRLLDEARRALVPGGLLVLGRVEGVPRGIAGWTLAERDARIYERRGSDT